jgi:DNA polymerase-3 subunit gamma/tau
MSYLVLARKWRPMTFSDLVGQDHVSRTLSNAILTGRVAHAFLFTGVRGVGKTTSARILAKALNCAKGPSVEPCLQCPACLEIAQGSDLDVQEIDGASYNGIDEVRRLQESLPYRPSRDRFKIVIVDEVHMLSQSAWNAFLKTLEEPPPHVKFIFATTEVHKVPITILSRCQRYDFKLIGAQVIGRRLRFVLDKENIQADDAAVALLAREAAGSMRDAMSLLDQAIAWGGDKLVGEEIAKVLGVAGHTIVTDLAAALVNGDAAACVTIIDRLANDGFDLVHVTRNLLEGLRNLVVARICKEPERLLDLTGDEFKAIAELAERTSVDDLLRLHLGVSQSFDQVVQSPQQRSAIEMLLVRLARRPPLLPIDELLGRLSQLEKRLQGGGAGQAPPRSGGAPGGRPRSGPEPERQSPARAAVGTAIAEPRVSAHVVAAAAPAPASQHALHAVQVLQPAVAEAAAPAAEPAPRAPVVAGGDERLLQGWRVILDKVRKANLGVASVLEHAVPLELSSDTVTLGFEQGSFYEAQARHENALDLLTRVVRDHFGTATSVSFSLQGEAEAGATTIYDLDTAARKARMDKERAELEQHPLVQTALRELGARISEIKLAKGS